LNSNDTGGVVSIWKIRVKAILFQRLSIMTSLITQPYGYFNQPDLLNRSKGLCFNNLFQGCCQLFHVWNNFKDGWHLENSFTNFDRYIWQIRFLTPFFTGFRRPRSKFFSTLHKHDFSKGIHMPHNLPRLKFSFCHGDYNIIYLNFFVILFFLALLEDTRGWKFSWKPCLWSSKKKSQPIDCGGILAKYRHLFPAELFPCFVLWTGAIGAMEGYLRPDGFCPLPSYPC